MSLSKISIKNRGTDTINICVYSHKVNCHILWNIFAEISYLSGNQVIYVAYQLKLAIVLHNV